jgi:hypothetical protein
VSTRLDLSGLSGMTRGDLVEAIEQANAKETRTSRS